MIDILKSLIKQFMPFAKEKMGFSRPPKLFLRDDAQNAANPLGKTGFYDPEKESITLYTTGRHPKDIMRSLAHELQHHTQKCNGDFESVQNMGEEGYAQADPHMRTMEIQAYQASIVFRDWEDSTKGTIYYEHLQKGDNSKMSIQDWKNGELKSLLAESWGFKADLSKLNEKHHVTSKATYVPAKAGSAEAPPAKTGDDGENPWEEEDKEIERLRSRAQQPTVAHIPGNKNVKEGCGDHAGPAGMEMMVVGDEAGAEGAMGAEEDVEGLAGELLSLAHRIGNALGVDSDVTSMGDEEMEEVPMEERRGRGRKGPHIRGPEDPRLRESVTRLHKAGYSKRQIKEFLTKAYSKALRS